MPHCSNTVTMQCKFFYQILRSLHSTTIPDLRSPKVIASLCQIVGIYVCRNSIRNVCSGSFSFSYSIVLPSHSLTDFISCVTWHLHFIALQNLQNQMPQKSSVSKLLPLVNCFHAQGMLPSVRSTECAPQGHSTIIKEPLETPWTIAITAAQSMGKPRAPQM